MDGITATRIIRSADSPVLDPHIPIIAMTAHTMQSDRDRCIAAGMNGYLAKPIAAAALFAMVVKFLDIQPRQVDTYAPAPLTRVDEDIFHQDELLDRVDGDTDLIHELLRDYLNDTQSTLLAMRDAYDERDWRQMQKLAHKSKGASGNIAAMRMQQILSDIEIAAGNGDDPQRIESLISTLHESFRLFTLELQRLTLLDRSEMPDLNNWSA
jgi:CheY-like chemotaxis protein